MTLNEEGKGNHVCKLYDAPFNFRTPWDDDTLHKLWSEDGFIMVATMPRLTDVGGTASQQATNAMQPGEVCGEVHLVKGWFGIGQEVSATWMLYHQLDLLS
ncbi:hypothetical protein M378DRAFT_181943 [Amanita muscaria Koide BX008]|uniref:Uncharacterized protein n=1 Tax=Amanita muscaria (strain Koide BX008) TaxID=946122 RepID=A0A0C2RXZ3_AMAMK|nr:hypothetical protein M378DRAFT_182290 [Amanita muscaria Koide BX008]KIL56505.1 hypothetical protein M378DRAFT_181943 [Amanita muscaria Koide BX008]